MLEVARLASGAKSMQAFLSEVVERAAEQYAGEPEIQAMLLNISEYQARREGKFKRIEGRAKKLDDDRNR